jgi:hypothetical protein
MSGGREKGENLCDDGNIYKIYFKKKKKKKRRTGKYHLKKSVCSFASA